MKRFKIKTQDSLTGADEDRKLAFSFGAVILALMLIVTGFAVFQYSSLRGKEEDRLSEAVAAILSESISRVSFSGKYHARLFVEDMQKKVTAIDSISVEAPDGIIIAHSDPSLNDTRVDAEDLLLAIECINKNEIITEKHVHNGQTFKEILIPYHGGISPDAAGIVRLGINIEVSSREKVIYYIQIITLITILTSGAIWIVFILSRYFGRRVRDLALNMTTIMESSPALIYMKDFDGRYLYINRAWAELFNTTNEQVRGKNDLEIFPAEIARGFMANDRYVMDNDRLLEVEEYAPLQDGIHSYQSIKVPIKDSTGKIYGLCGITSDITDKKNAVEALRTSEERLKRLVEQAPISIQIMDTGGATVRINEAFTRLWGVTIDDLKGYTIFEDEQLKKIGMMEFIKKGFSGETAQLPPVLYDSVDTLGRGFKRWVRANIYPVKDENGNIREVVLMHEDITEQKISEEALRESEEIFRHFMENSPIYIFFKDKDIRAVRLSRNFEQMLGMPLDNILGRTMDDLFPSDMAKSMIEDDKRVLYNGEIVTVDEELNGRFFTTIKFPIIIDGSPRYLAGYTIDITERKQAEKLVNAERERLLVTLRSIGDAVITTDVDGRIILINRVAEELTGWSARDAAGRDLMDVFNIVHEITREPGENPFNNVLRMGRIIELPHQTVLISRSGGERLIADSCAPILGSDSCITGIVLVFRDITEKKKTDMLIQNSQKLESLGVLAGGIAHDFNNLLSGIFGYLELLKIQLNKKNIEKMEETLNKSMQVFGRTKALTQQLLTFSRGGEPHKRNVQVSHLLVSNTEFVLSGTKVTSRFDIQEGLWPCFADEHQIAQVIDNIIINAVQAMPEGGEISVSAHNYDNTKADNTVLLPAGKYVRLMISDQGSGIPEEIMGRIFDPFYTTKATGTGLGLATSYSIIKKHGGSISVESSRGKGTTFTLYIPAAPDAHDNGTDYNTGGMPEFKGSILIMDDEDFMRHTASEILESMGISSVTAADGDEAIIRYIEAYKSGKPFTVVILDLTVKGGTGGRETLEKLKEFDPGVIAIASSGYSADPVMADPVKFGFSDRLIKPYRSEELFNALSRLVKK